MGIDDIIVEGKELKEVFDKKELQSKYNLWCRKVRICMKEEGFTEQEQEKVNVKMHYLENEYSENDALISLKKSLGDTIEILEENAFIYGDKTDKQGDLSLIEKILGNFYMYYRAMYKNPVHKKGTLVSQTLDAIRIGNEYDLQRMLYALLIPIFPTIRQEVYSDNGYGGMKADLYLDLYNLIIEIKCTRKSMSEKKLIEELGADGFHYCADIIYFFVFDETGIIKKPEAFKEAFVRKPQKDGKTVKVFVLQTNVF